MGKLGRGLLTEGTTPGTGLVQGMTRAYTADTGTLMLWGSNEHIEYLASEEYTKTTPCYIELVQKYKELEEKYNKVKESEGVGWQI